jgi:hypothetical protein
MTEPVERILTPWRGPNALGTRVSGMCCLLELNGER